MIVENRPGANSVIGTAVVAKASADGYTLLNASVQHVMLKPLLANLAFDPDADAVTELKAHYRRGGLGDMVLKRRLTSILQATISPIRERRADLARDPDFVMDVLRSGTTKGRDVTERTKREIVEGLGLFRLCG